MHQFSGGSRPKSYDFGYSAGACRMGLLRVLCGTLMVAWAAATPAQELPAGLREIDPTGVRGKLLLCGPDATAEQIVAALGSAAEPQRLFALVVGASAADGALAELRRAAPVGAMVWADRWERVDWSRLSVPDEGVAWVHASSPVPRAGPDREQLLSWLASLSERDVACAVSGALALELCESRMQHVAEALTVVPGLGRLPGIVGRSGADSSIAFETPGRVQFQLDPQGLVWISERNMRVPKEAGGGVSIWLPGDASQAAPSLRIDRDHPADLTMLRRAAVLRGAAAFPPDQVQTPAVPRGSLVIVGGGSIPDAVEARFIELAGGSQARIVVVPTAGERATYEEHRDAERFRAAGALEVTVLHTRDRGTAAGAAFLAPLRSATGVWFSGGRQWRLVDAYEGTPFVAECQAVLQRGGVIGGTSAGATILGEFLVRGHPLGNETMIAEGYERGFGFLPGTAIDQHFTQRRREADLELVHRRYPQLTCVGIDEATALVVSGSQGTVLGNGSVTILHSRRAIAAEAEAEPTRLEPGDTIDFAVTTGDAEPHGATPHEAPRAHD